MWMWVGGATGFSLRSGDGRRQRPEALLSSEGRMRGTRRTRADGGTSLAPGSRVGKRPPTGRRPDRRPARAGRGPATAGRRRPAQPPARSSVASMASRHHLAEASLRAMPYSRTRLRLATPLLLGLRPGSTQEPRATLMAVGDALEQPRLLLLGEVRGQEEAQQVLVAHVQPPRGLVGEPSAQRRSAVVGQLVAVSRGLIAVGCTAALAASLRRPAQEPGDHAPTGTAVARA